MEPLSIPPDGKAPWPDLLERALRLAARAHHDQFRKGSTPPLPYLTHPAAVALILARAGFSDEVLAAGLLHDVVEDTELDHQAILDAFGPAVAALVDASTERKLDEAGRQRPWPDRKREALDRLAAASVEARAVALADKLHNLLCIEHDARDGINVWAAFNAERAKVLDYYDEAVTRWGGDEPRLAPLVRACRSALRRLESPAEPRPIPVDG